MGSAGAQGISAISIVVLAALLAPEDFGRWAAATSTIAVLSTLTNFGELNAYLVSRGESVKLARTRAFKANIILTSMGFVLSLVAFYVYGGRVAILMIWASINIPIAGDALMLYAAGVKAGQVRRVIVAQWVTAAIRVVGSIMAAAILRNDFALAVSLVLASLPQTFLLWPRRSPDKPETTPALTKTLSENFAWASQQVLTVMPRQVDYLVASLLGSQAVVGVYYLAFQATNVATAWIGAPLSRSATVSLARAPRHTRQQLALSLLRRILAPLAGASVLLGLVAWLARPLVTGTWSDALTAFIIILASTPTSFMAPVLDALSVANFRLRQSIVWNGIDTLGTAFAACTVVSGSPVTVALSVSAWKCIVGPGRATLSLKELNAIEKGQIWILAWATPAIFALVALTLRAS